MYQMYITKENIQDAAYKCLASYYDERYSADIRRDITRTFTESVICYTRFAFDNGEIHEIDNDEIVVDYAVDEAAAKKVVKKRLNSDLFRIDEIRATDTLYACSVEDFLSVAHPVAKAESVE